MRIQLKSVYCDYKLSMVKGMCMIEFSRSQYHQYMNTDTLLVL